MISAGAQMPRALSLALVGVVVAMWVAPSSSGAASEASGAAQAECAKVTEGSSAKDEEACAQGYDGAKAGKSLEQSCDIVGSGAVQSTARTSKTASRAGPSPTSPGRLLPAHPPPQLKPNARRSLKAARRKTKKLALRATTGRRPANRWNRAATARRLRRGNRQRGRQRLPRGLVPHRHRRDGCCQHTHRCSSSRMREGH